MNSTALPQISLGRAEAAEILRELAHVTEALGLLPYRTALDPIRRLGDVCDTLQAAFPGGYAGPCDYCDAHVGVDEIGAQDFENGGHTCKACAAEIEAGDVDAVDRARAKPEPTVAFDGEITPVADLTSERLVPRMPHLEPGEFGEGATLVREAALGPVEIQLLRQLARGPISTFHSATIAAATRLRGDGFAMTYELPQPYSWGVEITAKGMRRFEAEGGAL